MQTSKVCWIGCDWRSLVGIEEGSSRIVLESSGWLAAHKRNRKWLERNPLERRRQGICAASAGEWLAASPDTWRAWGLSLFKNPAAGFDIPEGEST
jgi:hypothetical protein